MKITQLSIKTEYTINRFAQSATERDNCSTFVTLNIRILQ